MTAIVMAKTSAGNPNLPTVSVSAEWESNPMWKTITSQTTYKCEGCAQRHAAPAPYGGFRHTACSEACLVRARRRAHRRDTDARLQALVSTDLRLGLGEGDPHA